MFQFVCVVGNHQVDDTKYNHFKYLSLVIWYCFAVQIQFCSSSVEWTLNPTDPIQSLALTIGILFFAFTFGAQHKHVHQA